MKTIWKLSILAILFIIINGCKNDNDVTVDRFFRKVDIHIDSSAKNDMISIPKITDQYINCCQMSIGEYDGDVSEIVFCDDNRL